MRQFIAVALALGGLIGATLSATANPWYTQAARPGCSVSLLSSYADVPRGARVASVQVRQGQSVIMGIPSRHRYLVALQPGSYRFALLRGDWRLLLGPPAGGSLRFNPCHPTA